MGSDVRVENEFLWRLHIVQQATSAESRQDIKERRFSIAVFWIGGFKPPLLETLIRIDGWSILGGWNFLEAHLLDLDQWRWTLLSM
jgi:hypothetical protein